MSKQYLVKLSVADGFTIDDVLGPLVGTFIKEATVMQEPKTIKLADIPDDPEEYKKFVEQHVKNQRISNED